MNDEISSGLKPRKNVVDAMNVIHENLGKVLGGSNSRELSLAKTKFEEFQMWYERAIHVYLED